MKNRFATLALGASLATGGCVASGATLQTAQTLRPRDVSLAAGISVPVSTRFVKTLADTAEAAGTRLADSNTADLTQDEKRQVIESVMAVTTLSPAALLVLDARYGIAKRFDVGLRYAGPALGLDGKVQLLDGPWDLAMSLGYRYHTGLAPSVASKLYDVAEKVDLAGYKRSDLVAALYYSTNDERHVGFYGGLQYTLAFAGFDVKYGAVDEREIDSDVTTRMHTVGVTSGFRAGTEHFAFMFELALSYMRFAPKVLGEQVDLSGLIIEPGIGMRLTF